MGRGGELSFGVFFFFEGGGKRGKGIIIHWSTRLVLVIGFPVPRYSLGREFEGLYCFIGVALMTGKFSSVHAMPCCRRYTAGPTPFSAHHSKFSYAQTVSSVATAVVPYGSNTVTKYITVCNRAIFNPRFSSRRFWNRCALNASNTKPATAVTLPWPHVHFTRRCPWPSVLFGEANPVEACSQPPKRYEAPVC